MVHKSFHPCAFDKRSLSIGRGKQISKREKKIFMKFLHSQNFTEIPASFDMKRETSFSKNYILHFAH